MSELWTDDDPPCCAYPTPWWCEFNILWHPIMLLVYLLAVIIWLLGKVL